MDTDKRLDIFVTNDEKNNSFICFVQQQKIAIHSVLISENGIPLRQLPSLNHLIYFLAK